MILKGLFGYSDPKVRPAPHRLESILTRQHSGYYIARLPRDYPLTPQQKAVRDVARSCGIHKGMKRGPLVTAMIQCVGPKLRK